ncbi:CorA-like Mg2+ transporter protein, putative [Plasmodium malariae]|uniref:Magnesium transporter n=1 Tax=Plasmodium malariae TaxID=5858 RepID=A0A1A8W2S1_PLAMA|nr:CorA-like Mg2+ transporter protein, putative [Plasmodium malariae]SBS85438.1 magnesium transporter, putative [Plasmodium malariae]SCN12722.1 CorA-like Mg2+ transporter protein, putative [Plasmodium malariae]
MLRWWNHMKTYRSGIIRPYIVRCKNYNITTARWISKYTSAHVNSENKIFSKKNFNNVLMQNLKITEEDDQIICEKIFFSKYNLPYMLKIPVSDLRLIDTCNNNHNPTLLVRKNMILLRTGFISCVIRYNELWLFDPNNPLIIKATTLIKENLKERKKKKKNFKCACGEVSKAVSVPADEVVGGETSEPANEAASDAANKEAGGSKSATMVGVEYDEIDEMGENRREDIINEEKDALHYLNVKNNFYRYKGNVFFEFLCLDVCMQLSIKEYENNLDKINMKIRENILLQRKEENNEINILTNKLLRDMMKIKNFLQKLSNMLNALRSNIEKVLKNELDMKYMYLTYLNNNSMQKLKDHSDLEILLETHIQLTDEIYVHLDNVEQKITHYEELLRLNLDYNRNKFILLNAKISFSTLLFSVCSVITSLFGMNLKNFIENSDYAFCFVSIFVSFWSILGIYLTRNINSLLKFFDKYNVK